MSTRLLVCLGMLAAACAEADVLIETPRLALTLNDDATWGSLVDVATGRQCLAPGTSTAFATVSVAGKGHAANGLAYRNGTLSITFAGVDTTLDLTIENADDWLRLTLDTIEGTRPDSLTLAEVPIGITQNLGTRLNAGWDDRTVVCLMAAGTQVDCRVRGGPTKLLTAQTQDAPGPRLEGASAALIVCPTPEFKAIARAASHSFGLLTNEDAEGTPVKDTELVRGSYWFMTVTEANVDEIIGLCEQTGIRQVMMNSWSWCGSVGHYTLNGANYPNGADGLKQVVAKLHSHGILVGMHTFVSKVSKIDAYVTPVPDRRFWVDRQTVLAGDITADQTEIPVKGDLRNWPGSPVAEQTTWEGGVEKHQEVILGDEIVRYESIGPDGQWDTFQGCERGAWGTTAAAHPVGEAGRHYGVDGCIHGYIIDQDTSLMDEVADRIAGIFNECAFDMIYFDGGEDVDRRRFSHYVSNFQSQAMRRFDKRPIIHMGTIMTHRLWHSFARSWTVDTYLNTLTGAVVSGASVEDWPTVKGHIDKSVAYMLSVGADMMPGELGWFGIWPRGRNTDGLQLDEAEYLLCKSLGHDVPISLQTSIAQMESHPLTPQILAMVRRYEQLRIDRAVPGATRVMLQEQGVDFALLDRGGEPEFVRVEELPEVGGTHDVRAFVGEPAGGGSVAMFWHFSRDAYVVPDLPADQVQLTGFDGQTVPFVVEGGRPVILADSSRKTLLCPDLPADRLRAALEAAEVRPRPTEMIYVKAEDATGVVGEMQLAEDDPDARGSYLVCTGKPNRVDPPEWYAEYTVDVPRAGRWALWAHVRYPSGADDSFGLVMAGEEVALSGAQVLGNCGVNDAKWHWTGRGGGSTTVPPGEPVVLRLDAGPFTFRIYPREGPGGADRNPRLDLICLTDDPSVPPPDTP